MKNSFLIFLRFFLLKQKRVDNLYVILLVILFSNKVAAHGFGFYNDFDADAVLKNSKAYDFIQENQNSAVSTNNETAQPTKTIPSF